MLVSVTDFTALGFGQAAAVALAGVRLRRTWPGTPGSLGMWLWADPVRRRSGAVSVWAGEQELKEFVARPDHLRIVRAHRGRSELRSTTREFAIFEPSTLWAHALDPITEEQ
ncbi:hypothetical protein TN53_17500 [Streptomyces sp. WM6386]|nr:hypothetical protein TN53_17500 [Streptomyces sp. WM6386]